MEYNLEERTIKFSEDLLNLCKTIKINTLNENIVKQVEKSLERSELIIPFKTGDVVLLKTGDFKGMKGVLKNIDESKWVAIVNIEMLWRLTPVVVDIDKIELMN